MLKKSVICVTVACAICLAPWLGYADGNTKDVKAEAVPMKDGKTAPPKVESLEKGAGIAPAKSEMSDKSDRPPRMAPDESKKAGAGVHVVIDKDTLWDLSGRYLDNPFMWTEVWKVNPHISNPHLIYPGDEVIIPGLAGKAVAGRKRGEKPGAAQAVSEEEKTRYDVTFDKEEPFVDMGRTILKMDEKGTKVISLDTAIKEKVPVTSLGEVLGAGYILNDYDTYDWSGPRESGRLYYTLGDEMLVVQTPELNVGDYLVTANELGDIDHPYEFFDDLGEMIQPTGILQLTSKGGDYFVAEVKMAISEINEENILLPFSVPEAIYPPVSKNTELRGKWGYVVSIRELKELGEQLSYVFLDLGAKDGVKVGDMFEIMREEPSDYKLYQKELGVGAHVLERPEMYIGEAMVIYVSENSATARVTVSNKPIENGYRAYYKD